MGLEGAAKRRMLSLAAWAGAEEDMVAVCMGASLVEGRLRGISIEGRGSVGPRLLYV